MKINTVVRVNKWIGVLIEREGRFGLFQNPITGHKFCISLPHIKDEDILYSPTALA